MKFNWRANWEILLVLVIIVVGIVITTIAAIKNKDKHLLPLPGDPEFGLALGDSGNGLSELTSPQQVAEIRQPNSGQAAGGTLEDEQLVPASRRPQVQPMVKASRPSSAFHSVARESRNQQQHHDSRQLLKHDDNAEYSRPANEQAAAVGPNHSSGQDFYDALSTEPTPSQTHGEQANYQHQTTSHSSHGNGNNGARHYSNSRRHTNRTLGGSNRDNNQQLLAPNDESGGHQQQHKHHQLVSQLQHSDRELNEPVDLIDDIHTTRSNLAGSNEASNSFASQSGVSSVEHQIPMTPSLSLHGPYGVAPTVQSSAASMNQLGQLLMHNFNSKLDPSLNGLDSDDMMTSYSKSPVNGSGSGGIISDALLRDYNLAVGSNSSQQLLGSMMLANYLGSQQQQQQQSSDGNDAFGQTSIATTLTPPLSPSSPTQSHHRTFSSSLPISVLLGDLLKLTRPHQLASSALGGDQQASGNRPQPSILQQLRSLPGPLLSILQGIAPSSSLSSGGGTNADFGSSMVNHDASESNQYYHKISVAPNDLHSILARSLRSSSVLPAFPPPKGTPQTWIPPTAGGSPNVHTALNSNADFVASNVAGFVRAAQPQLSGAAQQSSEQNSYQHPQAQQSQAQQQPQQQHQQQHDNYQRQSIANEQTQPFSSPQQQQYKTQQANSYNSNDQNPTEAQLQQQNPTNGPLERNWVHLSGSNQNQNLNLKPPVSSLVPQQAISPDYGGYTNYQAPQSMISVQKVAPASNNLQQSLALSGGRQLQQVNNYNQAPAAAAAMYNSRPPSEMPVPLGYNPPQQAALRSAPSSSFEFNPAATVESSPKVSIVASNSGAQAVSQVSSSNAKQPQPMSAPAPGNQRQLAKAGLTRRRRSVNPDHPHHGHNDMGRVDEVMSSKYNANEREDEEEDSDLRPISVVRPDGRPMNSGRVRGFPQASASSSTRSEDEEHTPSGDRQMASQSQRSANHMNLGNKHEVSPMHHYIASYEASANGESLANPNSRSNSKRRPLHAPRGGSNRAEHRLSGRQSVSKEMGDSARDGNSLEAGLGERTDYKDARTASSKKHRKHGNLDTASSGLMSKLLGTASTNDELEDDMDDDEDPASEKRKEELEDAEFGIVNEERQNNRQPNEGGAGGDNRSQSDAKKSDSQADGGGGGGGNDSSLGSDSNDNEAYTRRNQQRSDIEFYGHPGEETRQLKYGILGSGNYEVVNGGIYPEADESTAAVNSVANYVRKPGGGGALLSGLPKLIAEHSHEPGLVGPQSAFMPGGRVGGFLRGASANPDELVGLMPATNNDLLAKDLSNPLLELIEANGGHAHLFDPNMLAHLGSSGSSSRTTHTSRDSDLQDAEGDEREINYSEQKDRKASGNKEQSDKMKTIVHNNQQRKQRQDSNNNNNYYNNNHADHDVDLIDEDANAKDGNKEASRLANNRKANKGNNKLAGNELINIGTGDAAQLKRQHSSISGPKQQRANQFNSYQILPSKKVTIFSDQDLDSAPSEQQVPIASPGTKWLPAITSQHSLSWFARGARGLMAHPTSSNAIFRRSVEAH